MIIEGKYAALFSFKIFLVIHTLEVKAFELWFDVSEASIIALSTS